ncbi:MAG: beta-propeller fold lactonase family protein, partial [Gammaproteobacteria bacterium]
MAFITLSFTARAELLQFNSSLNLDPGIHGLQVPGQSVVSANDEYLYLLGIEANVISVLQRSVSDNSLSPLFLYSNDAPDIDGIFLPWKAALSPAAVDNNQYLYVISRSSQDTVVSRPDTLAVFERDAATGELSFVDVYQDTGDPLDFNFPGDIVVSPDGNNIYITGVATNSIATFQFDAVNAQLNLLNSLRNGDSSNTITIFGLNSPQSLAISPDGRHIYVAAFGADAIVAFSRDTVSGILGYEFTLSNNDSTAGGDVAGLVNPIDIEISHDGNFVYTANAGNSSVTVFQRNSVDGSLDYVETYSDGGAGQSVVDSLNGITAIHFSPDNNHLVALSGLLDNSLTVFNRDSETGELGSHQVIADDVNGSFGIANSLGFVFTGDGRGLYTFSNNRKLGIFDNCTGVAPAANAGSDQTIDEGQVQAVQLNGSASGSTTNCGTVTEYAWSQIAGPDVTLQRANTAQPTFMPLASVDQDTQLVFELTVSNSMGATSTATVAVTIRDTSCSGIVPVADAGTDITVVENSESSVQLDGSGSAVSCGSITQYDWHQTAGPEVVVQNADTATPSFSVFDSIDHNIDLVFELTVTSNNGATDTSSVTVTLVNLNEAPVLVNDLCIIEPGTNLIIDVLSNDSDTDGPAALQIVSRDTPPDIQGAVSFSENGVQYTAPPTLLADGQGGVVP